MEINCYSIEQLNKIYKHLQIKHSKKTGISIFASVGEKAAAKKCLAMEGLLKEATELL